MTTKTTFAEQLRAALPAHTHHLTTLVGGTWTWTTPTGTWKVNRTFAQIRIDGTYTHVQAHLDPSQTIAILRILGAIDNPEQPITDDDYATQILGQTLTDEPECQRCLADGECTRCHGYGQIHGRTCADCTEAAAQP